MDILFLELRKLGLKEKEVQMYLAGLELGATSVQNIATKAGVTRPTAYEIIKVLEEKGLFLEAKQQKKRYVLAQSPEKILSILRLQKKELEEKEREFIRIIAALEAKYDSRQKGGVQVFKDKEGLDVLKEQILFTVVKDIIVFSSEMSSKQKKERAAWYENIRKRLGKVKVQEQHVPHLEGTLVLLDKAIFFSHKKQEGYLVDNPLVVESLKRLL